jgi:hypothetical protein
MYIHTHTHTLTHTHTHTHTQTTHIGQTKASFPDEASLFFLSFRRCAQMFALTAPFLDLSSALAGCQCPPVSALTCESTITSECEQEQVAVSFTQA